MADNNKRGKQAFFDTTRYNTEEPPVADETAAGEEYAPKVVFGATQGKKGHKAPRINMAFSPENHAWIKERSKQLGISATELVNAILEQERLK